MAMDRWRPFGVVTEPLGRGTVQDIQQEMNRLFDGLFGRPLARDSERIWVPVVDVYETKDDLVVKVELPGVREKEIDLSITGDLLTLRGERRFDAQVQEGHLHRVERAYGKFERVIPLTAMVQANKVAATFRDGVLEITLPKAEEVKPKNIQIQVQ